jgi:hypothetical protein
MRNLAFLLIPVAVIAATVFVKSRQTTQATQSRSSGTTYFSYPDIQPLKNLQSDYLIDQTSLDAWDERIFKFVSDRKLAPTTASKLYAYVLVAENDVMNLSLQSHGSLQGSIDDTVSGVLCELYAPYCDSFKANIKTDEYSRILADLVLPRVRERISRDIPQETYKVNTGDEYWDAPNPVTPDAGKWETWLIDSGSQFKASKPLPYNSTLDKEQLAAVKNTLLRESLAQRKAAEYWAAGPGTVTPGGIWLQIASAYGKQKNMLLMQYSQMRANLAMTLADAFISCWDTKFTYWTKRPNMRDASIKTVIPTPNFPSYTSGHATISAAASVVLTHYFPESENMWKSSAEQARDSRLWAGIHFSQDNEEGFAMGEKIGNFAISKFKI